MEGNFAKGTSYSVLGVVLGNGVGEQNAYSCFATEREAITHYFRRGFRYKSVVLFLVEYHGEFENPIEKAFSLILTVIRLYNA